MSTNTSEKTNNPFRQIVLDNPKLPEEPEVDIIISGYQEVFEKNYNKLENIPTFNGRELKGELSEIFDFAEFIQVDTIGELPNVGKHNKYYIVKETSDIYRWDDNANSGNGSYVPIIEQSTEQIEQIYGGNATDGK